MKKYNIVHNFSESKNGKERIAPQMCSIIFFPPAHWETLIIASVSCLTKKKRLDASFFLKTLIKTLKDPIIDGVHQNKSWRKSFIKPGCSTYQKLLENEEAWFIKINFYGSKQRLGILQKF